MSKSKKKHTGLSELEVILIIVLGFLILFIGIWWWYQQKKKTEAEKKQRKEWLEHRRIRLQKIIDKKKGLAEKLDKWFYWGYFSLRVFLVLLVLFYNYLVYVFNLPYCQTSNLNQWLGLFLNYTGGGVIILSLLIFILYRNPATLSTAIIQIKDSLEIFIYKKYLGIDNIIEVNEVELQKIEHELETIGNDSQLI